MQNWSPKRAGWDAATKGEYEKANRGEIAPRAALLADLHSGDHVLAG